MEKLINREQLAGMNIHYLFYSLEYFLDAQKEAGFKTIELWPGTPHFFLSYIEYSDCKHVRKLLDERDLTVKGDYTREKLYIPISVRCTGKKSSLKKVWHILRKLWMPVKNWV